MGREKFNDDLKLVSKHLRPSYPFLSNNPSVKEVIGDCSNWLGGVASSGVTALQNIKPSPPTSNQSGNTYDGASSSKNTSLNKIKPAQNTKTSSEFTKSGNGHTYSGGYDPRTSSGISDPRITSKGNSETLDNYLAPTGNSNPFLDWDGRGHND